MVPTAGTREVRYECSKNFAPLLAHLGVSLIVSTYQAGKLIVVGTQDRSLSLSFHNFKRAMGIALTGKRTVAKIKLSAIKLSAVNQAGFGRGRVRAHNLTRRQLNRFVC
jgi:hypothetical protein